MLGVRATYLGAISTSERRAWSARQGEIRSR